MVKVFKCLNCGFIFKEPKVEWRQKPLNPGVLWAIAGEVMYYPVQVCPRCGNDAITEVDVMDKDVAGVELPRVGVFRS